MKKYCVITDNYDLEDNMYHPPLQWSRFLPKDQRMYPAGVKCYYYNNLDNANRRITKEFIKGRSAKLYETSAVAQEFEDYCKNYVEIF